MPRQELIQTVLVCYMYLCEKSKRGYTVASQRAILELLKTYYGVCICRRTLNKYLNIMEAADFIKRKRRMKKGPMGGFIFETTLIIIKGKAYSFVKKVSTVLIKLFGKVKKSFIKVVPEKSGLDPNFNVGVFLQDIGANVPNFPS